MAVAVIGGLITSTVLSLLVVPAVFAYLDDLEQFIARMVRKLRGRPDLVDDAMPRANRERRHAK